MNVHGAIERASTRPAPPVQTLSIQDVQRIVRRRARLILLVFALVMGSAVAGYFLLPARYDATAVMRVAIDDIQPSADQPATTIRDLEQWRTHQIETQKQLLGSRMVARQTVRDLALHDDREFNPGADPDKRAGKPAAAPARPAGPTPQVIERTTDRLIAATTIAQDGPSDFIKVTVSSRSPEKAARIANKIAGNDLRLQVAERHAALTRNVQLLDGQTRRLRDELMREEMAVATYRRRHRIDAGPGRDADVAAMARLGSELAAAGAARAEAGARVGASGQVMSPLLADLRTQETVISRRLAELGTLYGRGHPDVARSQAELARVREATAVEAARIERQFGNEAAAQSARAGQLAGVLGAMRAQSLSKGVASVALADLERRAETARALYLSLSQRLQEAVRQRDSVRPDATVASVALVPTQPSFPRAGQLFGAATGASVIFAFIAVLLAEALQNRLRTAAEVLDIVDLPTFGMIPDISRRVAPAAHLKVANEPYSLFAEAIRATEAKLHRYLIAHGGKVLLVTSPLPGEGKTTIAISLAAAAVASGRTAVMIDLDLRRPGLRNVLDGSRCDRDLLDYLAQEATIEEILIASPTLPALKAIPVREPAKDPGAALNAPRLATMFAELRDRFDMVIVNTPPILAVSDADLLAEHVDATILLLDWRHTTQELLRSAVASFEIAPVGVVFNRVRYARHARLAYGDALQYFNLVGHYYAQPGDGRLAKLRRLLGG